MNRPGFDGGSIADDQARPGCTQRLEPPSSARGVRDMVLRDDLPGDTVFEMFAGLVERALGLAAANVITPRRSHQSCCDNVLQRCTEAVC